MGDSQEGRGKQWLDKGETFDHNDLEAAAKSQGVEILAPRHPGRPDGMDEARRYWTAVTTGGGPFRTTMARPSPQYRTVRRWRLPSVGGPVRREATRLARDCARIARGTDEHLPSPRDKR